MVQRIFEGVAYPLEENQVDKIYLVGMSSWDPSQQDGTANSYNFPSRFFTSLEEAELEYARVQQQVRQLNRRFCFPYIVQMDSRGGKTLCAGVLHAEYAETERPGMRF